MGFELFGEKISEGATGVLGLSAIAALRAVIMHNQIPKNSFQRQPWGGSECAPATHAITAANNANGSANTVCEKRISSNSWR